MRRSKFGLIAFSLFQTLLSFGFGQVTQVPYDPSPFAAAGYITGATLDNASDILSGGTLTLNDVTVIIPRNLLVNTPSLTAVAWSELFKADGTINLPLWPEVNWEASIFANFVGGRHIAGIVYIFQELSNLNEGFISHIDYDKGEMRVGGSFSDPNTGVRVVINDPVGRYGKVHGDWPLWTADTDNPSIVASTGYPVCVPRVDPATGDDPLCPKKNRPLDSNGKPLTSFTFERSPVAAGHPDPNVFAPLTVGDFIIYSGTIVPDGADRIIAAYTIEANLGLYTLAGTVPAYVRIETLQAGINGNPAGEIAETRVEGYLTDETATIEIFAIDVDPCTGVKTERPWGNTSPKSIDRKGQWRFRSSDPALSPNTREVVARVGGGTVNTSNGIFAGQLVSPFPFDGYIFPELIIFGDPQIPHEFNLLPFLAEGSGLWLGGIPGVPPTPIGPIVGQLSPWPGVNPPSPRDCPPPSLIPVADAGLNATSQPGAVVKLVGKSDTINLPVESLTFAWSQVSGSAVQLNGSSNATATFTAPTVANTTTLVFSLTVSNDKGSSNDTVSVTINPTQVEHITFETVTWKSGKGSGTLTVIARTDVATSELFLSASNPTIATTPMTSLGGGRWQGLVMIKPAPALVTVTSSGGASASTTVSNR